jgi:thiol-disulfide isomerase/thioredoxin
MAKYINFNSSGMKLPTGSEETGGFVSKIKSAGSNISTSTIIIMLVVVLFIGIAIYYYYHHISPSMKPKYNPNNEHLDSSSSSSNSGKSAELLLFYVDWCPHCKTAKPAWDEIKTQYENKTINGYKVIFTEINCTEETAEVEEMMNKYSIEGFPTIKLLKDGQIVEYDAKPTKSTLDQFLNTVL